MGKAEVGAREEKKGLLFSLFNLSQLVTSSSFAFSLSLFGSLALRRDLSKKGREKNRVISRGSPMKEKRERKAKANIDINVFREIGDRLKSALQSCEVYQLYSVWRNLLPTCQCYLGMSIPRPYLYGPTLRREYFGCGMYKQILRKYFFEEV